MSFQSAEPGKRKMKPKRYNLLEDQQQKKKKRIYSSPEQQQKVTNRTIGSMVHHVLILMSPRCMPSYILSIIILVLTTKMELLVA
jgi:hypothetical protein